MDKRFESTKTKAEYVNWEFKTFSRTGNGPKKWGNEPKKEETESLKLFKKPETDPKKEDVIFSLFCINGLCSPKQC